MDNIIERKFILFSHFILIDVLAYHCLTIFTYNILVVLNFLQGRITQYK